VAKYRVTRSKKKRVAENKAKGVEDGDIKTGAKGQTKRRWNEKKGRWEKLSVVSRRGVAFDSKRGAGAKGRDRENPPNSGSYQTGQGMTATTPPRAGRGYQAGGGQTKRKMRESGSPAGKKGTIGSKEFAATSRTNPGGKGKGYQTGSGVFEKSIDKAKQERLRKQLLRSAREDKPSVPLRDGATKISSTDAGESKFKWNAKKKQWFLTHRRNKGEKNWRLI